MEFRIDHGDSEEYEEVPSPFASKASKPQKLRNRKNVFNRPFATESTMAPTYVESSSRTAFGQYHEADFSGERSGQLHEAEIEYLEEEEESLPVVKRPAKANSKNKTKSNKNLLTKLGWLTISLLILRLIFMDRGVWDYFRSESNIRLKEQELSNLHRENESLKIEIARIKGDKSYQKLLAKEHLGVIAVDEFLILFAGEGSEGPEENKLTNI